jgi:hypothetical protein
MRYNWDARDRVAPESRFPDGFPGINSRVHATGVCHERFNFSYQAGESLSNVTKKP